MSERLFPDDDWLLRRWWGLSPDERDKEFWSPKQVAWKTGRSEAHVRSLVEQGKLPAIKIFGRIYIHIPSLFELLSRETTTR